MIGLMTGVVLHFRIIPSAIKNFWPLLQSLVTQLANNMQNLNAISSKVLHTTAVNVGVSWHSA